MSKDSKDLTINVLKTFIIASLRLGLLVFAYLCSAVGFMLMKIGEGLQNILNR